MTLAGRGVCKESPWITVDLLKLIVGCTAGCQFSHQMVGSLTKLCSASLRILHHYDWDCRIL